MSSQSTYRIDRDDLLARVDLVTVLDALSPGEGQGRGRQWSCPAPSHPDERPSVKVSIDQAGTQRWRCWSGGESGTAIDAVMAARSMPVGDAIRWLNDHYAHLEVIERRAAPEARPVGRPAAELLTYIERTEKLLWSGSGRNVRDWLNRRGLGDDVLRANRVGADPGRRFLPRPKGLPSGWPAAVFPALDVDGAVTYFQARLIDPESAGRDKYDNPSRRWASNPRVAWTQRLEADPSRSSVLVVAEGTPDALMAAQAGFVAVGVLGSMYPDGRVADQIAAYSTAHDVAVAVCFDCDPSESGAKGAAKLVELLEERNVSNVENVVPPQTMDLSDWAAATPEWMAAFDDMTTGAPAIKSPVAAEASLPAGFDIGLGS